MGFGPITRPPQQGGGGAGGPTGDNPDGSKLVATGSQTGRIFFGAFADAPAGSYVLDPNDASALPLDVPGGVLSYALGFKKSDLAFNVRDYGAKGDGVTNDSPAFQAAINAAGAVKGAVLIPVGATYLLNTAVTLVSDITILSLGRYLTSVKAGPGVANAVFLGTSGAAVKNVTLQGFGLDGNFGTAAASLKGVQVTNGSRITCRDLYIHDLGDAGIVYQGLTGISGTPYSRVLDCRIDNTGLNDGQTGFGVTIKDNSPWCIVDRCEMDGIKGGMGVGLNGSAGTGFPTHSTITNNKIRMAPSTTGFEAIGLTAGCDYATIDHNDVFDSQDNGISVSCAHSTCNNNTVDGAWNSGIWSAGNDNVIVGNNIRNVGKQKDGPQYPGINLSGCTNNVVGLNRITDDQTVKTTTFGIKESITAGGHQYFGNRITGTSVSAYSLLSDTSSFLFPNGIGTLVYAATITPDASSSAYKRLVVTDGNAFTITNPSNAFPGAVLTVDITNSSSGAMGTVTWGVKFRFSTPFTAPAAGGRTVYEFVYDGTTWMQK
ncbi:hypothetical protein GTQ99_00300 [Kineococcus sp. T13]|uniref:glycosyl hydrolase family 28-related protein n=1 Tax=Kineococcus vitellinus TaxID=2696565 RepID=UPI001412248C|nr:right-handed parallel beta-helix repeat-containing protein [Kineococcus vitellinus]NAZ73871.1 hypothetical protein [Kineococcus vitellinus]